jgi:CheY-like chemotaxis protein
MAVTRATLLCIDDHQNSLSGWALFLQHVGYSVLSAANPDEGLQLFATNAIDAVVLDYSMPDLDGGRVAAAMKRIKPNVPILMFTAHAHLPAGAVRFVDSTVIKGQPPQVLLDRIEELLAAAAEREERGA